MAKNYTPIHIGGTNKEAQPALRKTEISEVKEVAEHKVEEEVRPYVSPRAETIKLPQEIEKLGVQPSTTTSFPTYQNIKTPLPDEKIIVGMQAPITSSFRWLATLALYILRLSHLTLKKIHGKVVRVISG